jgi:hypothetical protein
MNPTTFSSEHQVATLLRNLRTAKNMVAAQAARDRLIAARYADPAAVAFGGPCKAPERGAPGIAGMRADLQDGRLAIPALRAARIGQAVRHVESVGIAGQGAAARR